MMMMVVMMMVVMMMVVMMMMVVVVAVAGQIRRPLVDDSRHARAQPTIISISSPRKATVRIEFGEEVWMMMERGILSFKQ